MKNMDKEQYLKEVGSRIKEARLEKGYTLEELANKVGYKSTNARSTMQKIESGKSDIPTSKVSKIAEALEVPVGKIMGWWDEFDEELNLEQIEYEANFQKRMLAYADAFNLYDQLDQNDQAEIRGEMKQMLKDDKYGSS